MLIVHFNFNQCLISNNSYSVKMSEQQQPCYSSFVFKDQSTPDIAPVIRLSQTALLVADAQSSYFILFHFISFVCVNKIFTRELVFIAGGHEMWIYFILFLGAN